MSKPLLDDVFKFQGRRNRWSFFWGSLLIWLLGILFLLFGGLIASVAGGSKISAISSMVVMLGALLFLITPPAFLMPQRLRDLEKSGWWALVIAPIPLVGAVINSAISTGVVSFYFTTSEVWFYILSSTLFIIYFACFILLIFAKGTNGINKYGPDPLADKK